MSLTWGKTKEPVLYSLFPLSFLTRWRYGYLLLKSAKLVSLEICRTRRLRHHCIICQCLILLSEQVTQRACTPRLDSSLKVFAFPFHVWHTSSMFVNVNILSNLVNMPHVALPLHSSMVRLATGMVNIVLPIPSMRSPNLLLKSWASCLGVMCFRVVSVALMQFWSSLLSQAWYLCQICNQEA